MSIPAIIRDLNDDQLLAVFRSLSREELETLSAQCNGSLSPFVRAKLNELLTPPIGPASDVRLARAQAVVMAHRHDKGLSLWNPLDKIRSEAPDKSKRVMKKRLRNGSDVFGEIEFEEAQEPEDDDDVSLKLEILADLAARRKR